MIIDKLVRGRLNRDPTDPWWYTAIGSRTRAGVDITEETAMTYSACWAATRLLSGTASYLPFGLFQRLPNGKQRECVGEPLYHILHDAPNPEMSSMMWRASKIQQQINAGNCFSEIERTVAGDGVVNLWPIHHSRVELKCNEAEQLYYEVKNNDGSRTPLPYNDVFHVPSMISDDGRWGKGVIRHARETIGRAIATERYGAAWFGSGGRPTAVLRHPRTMDKEARDNLRREWNELYGGPDTQNRVAVLWEGMEYSAIASDPEDSQFIQSQEWNVEDVARWYGVPPQMIQRMIGSDANTEQRGIEFVKFSLLFWIKLWEQEVWRKLLSKEQRLAGYYAKFTVDALERGDLGSRTAALAQQFFNGALTLNEWAKIEDRPPIGPLGDLHFVQSAMVPLEMAAKGPIDPSVQSQVPSPTDVAPQTAKEIPEPPAARSQVDELTAMQRQQLADTSRALESLAQLNERLTEKPDSTVHLASLDVVADLVGVMLDREAKDAVEAAKRPAEFIKWLDKFYEDHGERMRKALAKPIRACVLASGRQLIVDDTLRAAVASHVEASRTLLLEAAGGPPDQFAEAIAKCVGSWKRTEIIDLLKGE